MPLATPDYTFVRELLLRRASIQLEAGKEYLIDVRLGQLARRTGHADTTALLDATRRPGGRGLEQAVVEAMTINETSFFRDTRPFDLLRLRILPELIRRRSRERALAIWSAASSSGQEPYSLAMLVREHFPQLREWTVRIHATDLSTEMVERTRSGLYHPLELRRGLPPALQTRYFVEQPDGMWRASDELRSMVVPLQMNLCAPWPALPRFDVVLLRNVMIYFSVEARRGLLRSIKTVLQSDGCLLLGAAETTIHIDTTFEPVLEEGTCWYRMRAGGQQ